MQPHQIEGRDNLAIRQAPRCGYAPTSRGIWVCTHIDYCWGMHRRRLMLSDQLGYALTPIRSLVDVVSRTDINSAHSRPHHCRPQLLPPSVALLLALDCFLWLPVLFEFPVSEFPVFDFSTFDIPRFFSLRFFRCFFSSPPNLSFSEFCGNRALRVGDHFL